MNGREREIIIERITDSAALSDVQALEEALKGVHPTEIAQAMRYMDPEDQERIIELLSPEDASEALLALRDVDEGAGIELAEELDSDDLSEMLNVMEPDDAADVVADLPEEDMAEVLDLMEDEESRSVQELLRYEEDTAGGIMTSEFAALGEDKTTDEAIQYLRDCSFGRQIFYIYVTGAEDEFLGTVGIVVGISIFLAVSLSATMGVLIPITFKRINVDPAVASGPLITMINDITGLLVYLTMSTILLSRLT